MPVCAKCGNDIRDRSWDIHQIICTGNESTDASAKVDGTNPGDSAIEKPILGATNTSPAPATGVQADEVRVEAPNIAAVAPVVATTEAKASAVPSVVAPLEVAQEKHDTPFNMNGDEIFYPSADPNFIVPSFIADSLDDTQKMSKIHPTNMLITGQAGGGKTSLALQFAAKYNRPAVVADFGVLQEPQQLFQTTHLIENENGLQVTETRESAFIRGIETPNCVVIMDELTRVENERCLNPLMPLLDGRKSTWIDELHRRVHVADGVVFIATINEGSMFAGISSLDAALRDRFREVFMDYLPGEQESKILQAKTGVPKLIANSLAEFAYVVRNTPGISRKISTRQLIHAAEAYSVGATLWRAVETAMGNYNDDAWRQQVLEIFSLNIKDPDEYSKWLKKPRKDSYVDYK